MGHQRHGSAVLRWLKWQLAGWPLGTMKAERGLHTGVWVAFGSPTRATHRCLSMSRCLDPQPVRVLDPQERPHTGVGIPNRGYIRVFEYAQALGFTTGATVRFLALLIAYEYMML